MIICESNKCTGCFACVNKCPVNCIEMVQGELGHIYPQIDDSRCIQCHACEKVCPENSYIKCNKPINTYAAYSLDEDENRTSSSGGIAAEFSKQIIRNGGIVYGCSSLIEYEVCHIRVDTEENLALLKGSKYVQSHINNVYKDVRSDLENGKRVLFTGTPCQIAGLKKYLNKEYDGLIAVDLICHGVPSQKLLLEHLENYTLPPYRVTFRDENGYALKILDASGVNLINLISEKRDLYFTGFSKNLFFRDSCYTCNYAKDERCSDITIGDFWGLGKNTPFYGEMRNGVSVLLVNTDKGKAFLSELSSFLYLEERQLLEAINGNAQLRNPSLSHPKRNDFKRKYELYGFAKAVKKVLLKEIIKYRVLYFIEKSKFFTSIVAKMRGN